MFTFDLSRSRKKLFDLSRSENKNNSDVKTLPPHLDIKRLAPYIKCLDLVQNKIQVAVIYFIVSYFWFDIFGNKYFKALFHFHRLLCSAWKYTNYYNYYRVIKSMNDHDLKKRIYELCRQGQSSSISIKVHWRVK